MHTLPLPKVETELNPTLNPIPSPQNVCNLPQQASIRPAGPAAADPLRKASEPAGEKLIPAPSSRPPVPAFDFGIPERQDSKPNSAPSPSNAGTPGANPDPPPANPDSKFRIPSRLFPSRGLTSQQLQFLLRVSPSALKGERSMRFRRASLLRKPSWKAPRPNGDGEVVCCSAWRTIRLGLSTRTVPAWSTAKSTELKVVAHCLQPPDLL